MAELTHCIYYHERWEKCLHFDMAAEIGGEMPDCVDLLSMGRCPLKRTTNKAKNRRKR